MRIAAMLAQPVPLGDLDSYLRDDRFWAEWKLNGMRVLVHVQDNQPQFLNRSGTPFGHSIPPAVDRAFRSGFSGEWVLDGELLDGTYWLFDALQVGRPITGLPLRDRRQMLEHLFRVWQDRPDCVKLVQTARTTAEKRALAKAVLELGGEGLVIKRPDARYHPAARTTGMLKIKYVSTADVVVDEVYRQGKDSIGIVLFDGKRRIPVGAVNMQGKRAALDSLSKGDVVEVRYLYASLDSHKLVQPEFLIKRTDKRPEECTLDQLRYVSKAVVEVA